MDHSNAARPSAPIPSRLNAALAAACLMLSLFQYYLLPLALLPAGRWWALLLVPCALATTANWSLIHEAIHGLLFGDARANEFVGRLLAVAFGSPLEALRFAHLLHHRLNGTPADRPEYYEIGATARPKAALIYYPRLLFGTYAAELAGTIVCLLPHPILERVVRLFPNDEDDGRRARAYLLKPDRLLRMRLDAVATLGAFALGFWCYGAEWPLLVAALVARGLLVSIADNSYHYGAPLGDRTRSALNLELGFSAGILNFNLHRVHHLHPSLPWSGLPAAFRASGDTYDCGYARAMLRQFAGPLSDAEYRGLANAGRTAVPARGIPASLFEHLL